VSGRSSRSERSGRRGRHKRRASPETLAWEAETPPPPRPCWMPEADYVALLELRDRLADNARRDRGRSRMTAMAVDSLRLTTKLSKGAGREPDWRGERVCTPGGRPAHFDCFPEDGAIPSLALRGRRAVSHPRPAPPLPDGYLVPAARGFGSFADLDRWLEANR
jgi:hypothetical protein